MINAARRQQLSSLSSERKRVYQKNKLFKRIEADIKERDKRRIPGKVNHLIVPRVFSLHWAKLKYTPFLTLKEGVFQFGPVYDYDFLSQ